MTLVHLNFESKYLNNNTDVNIILPDRHREQNTKTFYLSGRKYRVLWLLHGTFGDYTDWIRKSNVELYAAEHQMIVVMPSGLNADYADWPKFGMGYDSYHYLLNELMPLVHGWFPASDDPKDNFIAGLSMGGRGTLLYALNHPEKFAAAYIMSYAPSEPQEPVVQDMFTQRRWNQLENAGGLEKFIGSYQDTWNLIVKRKKEGKLPRLYFACGTADPLMYEAHVAFEERCREYGIDAQFFETEGYAHEWRFWDECVEDAITRFSDQDVFDEGAES